MRHALAAAGLLVALSATAAGARPLRVVSINPCLDTILVNVADRDQIAALSHYARDPQGSTISDVARSLPYTYETAEEVIALAPDLVLASRHSALATRNALRRTGIRTELFTEPQTVTDSLAQVRAVARLVGQSARGEEVVGEIESALAAARPAPEAPPVTALLYQRNGLSSGSGTLVDDMLRRVGFINAAAAYGLQDWGWDPLESTCRHASLSIL